MYIFKSSLNKYMIQMFSTQIFHSNCQENLLGKYIYLVYLYITNDYTI